jgi:hypothetical protein
MSSGPSRDIAEVATDGHVWRMQFMMEQLDLDIARLALALGVSLGTKEGLSQALRDSLIQKCAAETGADATWQIMIDVESQMAIHGFLPGADGIPRDLLHRPA